MIISNIQKLWEGSGPLTLKFGSVRKTFSSYDEAFDRLQEIQDSKSDKEEAEALRWMLKKIDDKEDER